MCTLLQGSLETRPKPENTRRLRLWETKPGWHCAIVGTCLSMGDLHSLFRKTRIRISNANGTDFQLHSLFVQEAIGKSRTSKLMTKLLDKKHAAAIRQFQSCETVDELQSLWQTASARGDVPGAFWAIMTHPAATEKFRTIVYGEVHMLSHLVGSANHADTRSIRRMEQEIDDLKETIDRDRRRFQEKILEKDQAIATLQSEAIDLKARAAAAPVPPTPADAGLSASLAQTRTCLVELREQTEALLESDRALKTAKAKLEKQNRRLLNEIRMLESAVGQQEDGNDEETCPFDLNGRCILYVGGRSPQVCHLRKLVNQWNGELLHHDGGVERSIDELARNVSKADTVVFPTDCVSHSAIYTVKRICRQNMKRYVPLRTTGVASLVAGLKKEMSSGRLHS